jgi:protein required for attachment to host cells
MYPGKTKNGVPIRSTQGMRISKPLSTWILVADRSRLRLFERTKTDWESELQLKEEFLYADGRAKGSELMSDRPGRTFESRDISHHGQAGGTRHSYGGEYRPKDHAMEALVKEAVHLLGEHKIGHLLIVAEPRLIGRLYKPIKYAMPQTVIRLYEKDYSWLNETGISERLLKMKGNQALEQEASSRE